MKEQTKETVDQKKLTKKLKEKRVTVLKVIEENQKYKSFENKDHFKEKEKFLANVTVKNLKK